MDFGKRVNVLESRISKFLARPDFGGFDKRDLFIKRLIDNPWGQDIAALSNMSEGYLNLARSGRPGDTCLAAVERIISLATHAKVNPYKRALSDVKSLGSYGYYLEHLNICLGCYVLLGGDQHSTLHQRISDHLVKASLKEENAHARLLPHVKMRWTADQAAILYSLWLFDQATGESVHKIPADRWEEYICNHGKHPTGLFETEVMGCKRYSKQPRGCAIAYLVHYANYFAPHLAENQWGLFKDLMFERFMGFWGFREYLPDYQGKMTPDSGLIIGGLGAAASGLAFKAASSMRDEEILKKLVRSAGPILGAGELIGRVPGLGLVSAMTTDLLSTAIQFSALTKATK